MKFRTIVETRNSNYMITHGSTIVMLGSCFTTSIGQKLVDSKFNVCLNPFGTLYNPISIKQNLELLINKKQLAEDDVFFNQNLYNSYYFHSSFALADKKEYLQEINRAINGASDKLSASNVLLITFGTSYVYENINTKQVVANCHKQPTSFFSRRKLGVNEIVASWSSLISQLNRINPNLKIIFTVSPIRHLRDGAHDNQLSKSTLLLAIEKLMILFPSISYFPAYEIVLDDLRDYRFYESDMCHPNDLAIEYIWEKFGEMYFDAKTVSIISEWNKIKRNIMHRPFNPSGDEYMQFLKQSLLKLKSFQDKYPFICITSEIEDIENRMNL